MDFKLTEEQQTARKKMFDVCRELDGHKPAGLSRSAGEGRKAPPGNRHEKSPPPCPSNGAELLTELRRVK